MNEKLNRFKNTLVSTKIITYFSFAFLLVSILFYFLMPALLNYPPDTINTQFDKDVSLIYYIYQYFIVITVILIIFSIYCKISLKTVDNWLINKDTSLKAIQKVRKKCLFFPYYTYLFIQLFPIVIVSAVLAFTGSHPGILIFKIGILIFSFSVLVSSLFFVISKNILYSILYETSSYINVYKIDKFGRITLKNKLLLQLVPSVLLVALILSLIGYSRIVYEKGELLSLYYNKALEDANQNNYSVQEVYRKLSPSLLNTNDFIFVVSPDNHIETSNHSTLSDFFIKYMNELSEKHGNRVYEIYTVDAQGIIKEININNQTYKVGIYYEITATSSLVFFIISSFTLFFLNLILIRYVTSSISKDIKVVVNSLEEIVKNKTIIQEHKLPITSNDILGDLSVAFNSIRKLTKEHINEIEKNQDIMARQAQFAALRRNCSVE